MHLKLFLLALVLSATLPAGAQAPSKGFQYKIEPTPAWVLRREIVPDRKPPDRTQPAEYVLFDNQVSLREKPRANYYRIVQRANDQSGVDGISPLQVPFNADYQTLAFHEATVWREGKRLDRLKSARINLIQREKDLERRIYDGTVTAVLLLEDVRVGDVVDVSLTIRGHNPVLGERYSDFFAAAFQLHSQWMAMRILHPPSRKLQLKHVNGWQGQPQTRVLGDAVELSFEQRDVPALPDAGERPHWHTITPGVEISEYQSWEEVAQWARPLYQVPAELSPALLARIEAFRRQNLPPRERVAAVLEFVQSEIRYFGIEIGTSSHKPAHPNETFSRRYGDCKDKSLLLTAMLRRLGVDAVPALVSLQRGRFVQGTLPTSLAFDHVITRVNVEGRTFWLDATRQHQYGRLETLGWYDFGAALPIGERDGGLQEIALPEDYVNALRIVETFRVEAYNQPAMLTIEATLTGARAEHMRGFISQRGIQEATTLFASDVVRRFPSAESLGPITVSDDRPANQFRIIEKYRIRDFLAYQRNRFYLRVDGGQVLGLLPTPKVANRNTPFAINYPSETRHTVVVELPEQTPMRFGEPTVVRDAAFSYRHAARALGDKMQLEYEARTLRDHVPAAALPGYLDKVKHINQNIGMTINFPVTRPPEIALAQVRAAWAKADASLAHRDVAAALAEEQRYAALYATQNINAGRLTPRQIAHAYVDRAVAHGNLQEIERALPDLAAALRIEPEMARAHAIRGALLTMQRKWLDALESFKAAETLSRGELPQHVGRGESLYYLGRYAEAAQAFESDLGAGTNRMLSAIWYYLARQKVDGSGARRLDEHLAGADPDAWPAPVARHLLGKLSEAELLKIAANKDKSRELMQLCEAYFYIGHGYLLKNDARRAREFFEKAVQTEVKMFREYAYAAFEAERLR
jgi:lipoprotein NlpI/transglutaminase-like putative cysteine protease